MVSFVASLISRNDQRSAYGEGVPRAYRCKSKHVDLIDKVSLAISVTSRIRYSLMASFDFDFCCDMRR